MDKLEEKYIEENVKMRSLLSWFFDYIEFDESLTETREEKTYSFPNVVISLSEHEVNEMNKILGL